MELNIGKQILVNDNTTASCPTNYASRVCLFLTLRTTKNEFKKKPTIAICSNLFQVFFTLCLYSKPVKHQSGFKTSKEHFFEKKKEEEFSVYSRNGQNSSKYFRLTSDANSRVEGYDRLSGISYYCITFNQPQVNCVHALLQQCQ